MQAIKRLDDQARRLERTAHGPSVESYIAGERAASPDLDGRSVFGWERDLGSTKADRLKAGPRVQREGTPLSGLVGARLLVEPVGRVVLILFGLDRLAVHAANVRVLRLVAV